jgi:uncharacterized membrane protein
LKRALSGLLALAGTLLFPALVLLGVWKGLFVRWAALGLAAKAYPLCVNLGLLASFGWSLWQGPPVVERLARLQEPDLPAHAVRYTRKVTQAWCAFFAVNAVLSLATALWGSQALWALYNGAIAYALMGAFFTVEWLIRRRVRARAAAAGLEAAPKPARGPARPKAARGPKPKAVRAAARVRR